MSHVYRCDEPAAIVSYVDSRWGGGYSATCPAHLAAIDIPLEWVIHAVAIWDGDHWNVNAVFAPVLEPAERASYVIVDAGTINRDALEQAQAAAAIATFPVCEHGSNYNGRAVLYSCTDKMQALSAGRNPFPELRLPGRRSDAARTEQPDAPPVP